MDLIPDSAESRNWLASGPGSFRNGLIQDCIIALQLYTRHKDLSDDRPDQAPPRPEAR